jgi:hypothetical protein
LLSEMDESPKARNRLDFDNVLVGFVNEPNQAGIRFGGQ